MHLLGGGGVNNHLPERKPLLQSLLLHSSLWFLGTHARTHAQCVSQAVEFGIWTTQSGTWDSATLTTVALSGPIPYGCSTTCLSEEAEPIHPYPKHNVFTPCCAPHTDLQPLREMTCLVGPASEGILLYPLFYVPSVTTEKPECSKCRVGLYRRFPCLVTD